MNRLEIIKLAFARISLPLQQKMYWLHKIEMMDSVWIEKLFLALTAKNKMLLRHLALVEKAHIKHMKQEVYLKLHEGMNQLEQMAK